MEPTPPPPGGGPPPPFYPPHPGTIAYPSYYRAALPTSHATMPMPLYQASQPRVSSSLKPRADGRKKFTSEQTLQMEQLFRENTHPSREQRVQLAGEFDVGEKSIGIWFQNRRQAVRRERKLAESKGLPLPTPASIPTLPNSSAGASMNPSNNRPTLDRVVGDYSQTTPKERPVPHNSDQSAPRNWDPKMTSSSAPSSFPGSNPLLFRSYHPSSAPSQSHPYTRPRSNTLTSSDVDSDSQYSTSTRDGGGASSSTSSTRPSSQTSSHTAGKLSRTRSMSPTRPKPRVAGDTLVRAHSDVVGGARKAPPSSTKKPLGGRPTLEWACENAKRLPSSPLRPTDDEDDVVLESAYDDDDEEEVDTPKRSQPTRSYPRNTTRTRSSSDATEDDLRRGREAETDTETEGEYDGRTETSFADDMEALTPSEGRSISSIHIASSSPRSSFSSTRKRGGSGSLVESTSFGRGQGVHERWYKGAGSGLDKAGVPGSTMNSLLSMPRLRAHGPVPVPPPSAEKITSSSASSDAPLSSSPNSQAEIDAALALCDLLASG